MADDEEPIDWPPELPGGLCKQLTCFEEELLCPICSGFFVNPLSLNCGHSYCSLCIRKHLDKALNKTPSADVCPTCREKADSFDLRKNSSLSELVASFKKLRHDLLGALKQPHCSEHSPSTGSCAELPQSAKKSNAAAGGASFAALAVSVGGTAITKRLPHYSFHGAHRDAVKKTIDSLTQGAAGGVRVLITERDSKETLERRLRELIHLHNAQMDAEQETALSLEQVILTLNSSEQRRELEACNFAAGTAQRRFERAKQGQHVVEIDKKFSELIAQARKQKESKNRTNSECLYGSAHSIDDDAFASAGDPALHTAKQDACSEEAAKLVNRIVQVTATQNERRRQQYERNATVDDNSQSTADSPLPVEYDWGPWRVVMSRKLQRPFFFNTRTNMGQFRIPDELHVIVTGSDEEDNSELGQSSSPNIEAIDETNTPKQITTVGTRNSTESGDSNSHEPTKPTEWNCKQCTYLNRAWVDVCGMCGCTNPQQRALLSKWTDDATGASAHTVTATARKARYSQEELFTAMMHHSKRIHGNSSNSSSSASQSTARGIKRSRQSR